MLIYLIAVTVFMIECMVMYFIYFSKQKQLKHDFHNAYVSRIDLNKFFYFILIPCLNEGKVIQSTLQHLVNLDGQKQIIAIDDDSIDDTLIKIKQVAGPILTIERKLPNARTGKGDSLNSAMPLIQHLIRTKHLRSQNCIVGVVDADGILSSNSLYKLNDSFNDYKIAAVQLRVKMKHPQQILQTFQDVEFFTINHLMQLFRMNINAVALCGNGQFFRFSSVYQALGSTPWGNALLEDYELTLKMELKGLKIQYLADAYVSQEALLTFKSLIRQRARWSQGGWNCWKYIKQIYTSDIMSSLQKLDTYLFFSLPILNVLADFSIIYLTMGYILKYFTHPEFLIVSMLFLAIIGTIFGTFFLLIYLHELNLTEQAKIVIDSKDLVNRHMSFVKAFLAIGLLSYIYIVLFFSLIVSAYHILAGQNSWVKTKRI